MARSLALLGSLLAVLAAAAPAAASTPVPWCGTDVAGVDRLPDAANGYAIHVIYAFPADSGDRFAEWAPRIAGDVTAIEAWWRGQDPTRAPRFDVHAFPCAPTLGALDLTRVQLQQPASELRTIGAIFSRLASVLPAAPFHFADPDKKYLVYFDGPLDQAGTSQVCGQSRRGFPQGGRESFAFVYLAACALETRDELRAYIAAHELLHALNALATGAPHACPGDAGHPCDSVADALTATNTVETGRLVEKILDVGRDDYYGHGGAWWDVQDSTFLEWLDAPDRAAPSTPQGLSATSSKGAVRLSWLAATDDVGPVGYRVYRDGALAGQGTALQAADSSADGETHTYVVKATDSVSHLSQPATIRFTVGLGIVDATGKLVRDTVAPPPVTTWRARRRGPSVVLSWTGVRDPGGLRGYRVAIGGKTVATVPRPSVTLARARVRAAVTIVALDRAGNVSTPLRIPAARLR